MPLGPAGFTEACGQQNIALARTEPGQKGLGHEFNPYAQTIRNRIFQAEAEPERGPWGTSR